MSGFFSQELFSLLILPLLIFISRVIDVSIGTVRIIFVSRGYKFWAAFLGFFEAIFFILAVGQIMNNMDRWYYYAAYGAGFAFGNYVGIYLEEKIAVGILGVRVIAQQDAELLITHLKNHAFGITSAATRGMDGKIKVVFTILRRKKLAEFVSIVKKFNPEAFISIEDARLISQGVLPFPFPSGNYLRSFLRKRK